MKISAKNTNETPNPTPASIAWFRIEAPFLPSNGLCVTTFSLCDDIPIPPTQNNYKSIYSKNLYRISQILLSNL